MASEMMERVARAICESELMNPDDALGGWIHWQHAARAAIEAMRIATIDMRIAAQQRQIDCGFVESPNGLWTVMVDEALKEGGQ